MILRNSRARGFEQMALVRSGGAGHGRDHHLLGAGLSQQEDTGAQRRPSGEDVVDQQHPRRNGAPSPEGKAVSTEPTTLGASAGEPGPVMPVEHRHQRFAQQGGDLVGENFRMVEPPSASPQPRHRHRDHHIDLGAKRSHSVGEAASELFSKEKQAAELEGSNDRVEGGDVVREDHELVPRRRRHATGATAQRPLRLLQDHAAATTARLRVLDHSTTSLAQEQLEAGADSKPSLARQALGRIEQIECTSRPGRATCARVDHRSEENASRLVKLSPRSTGRWLVPDPR